MNGQRCVKAFVLAAGVGSRLHPLSQQCPKPMVPLANRPVMEHIIRLLRRHGIRDVVSNVHHLSEKITDYFGDGAAFNVDMTFVREKSLTGDAGGMRACRSLLSEGTFLVIMGDLVTDIDLTYLMAEHRRKGALATVALKYADNVQGLGVAVVDHDGFITRFQEKPTESEAQSHLTSTGIYVFEPEIFEHIPHLDNVGFGKQLFPQLIESGQNLLGVEVWGYWSDIGTIPNYRRSSFDAIEGSIDLEIPAESFCFGWRADRVSISPSSVIDGSVLLGTNSHIGDYVWLNGSVVIGENCLVQDGAEIQNSIIWPGTIVGPNARIRNSVIGSDCQISAGSSIIERVIVEPCHNLNANVFQQLLEANRRKEIRLSRRRLSTDIPLESGQSGCSPIDMFDEHPKS